MRRRKSSVASSPAPAESSRRSDRGAIQEYRIDSGSHVTHTSTLRLEEDELVRSQPRRRAARRSSSSSSSSSQPGLSSSALLSSASRFLTSLFLPTNYPHSVTADYLPFQIFDTVQGVSSYLRGILCTQAILQGYGVGDSEATAASATINSLFRDAVGMLGGMLFAWWGAASFGSAVKRYRLFADVMNDFGLTLELLSPLFPRHFLLLACCGTLCRALCGVAAGATRASLMTHFALQGNVADISAKEGIQETAVTLLGLVAGWQSVSLLNNNVGLTWLVFLLLTAVHLAANVMAVRCLVLRSLDTERCSLLIRHFLAEKRVLTPEQAAQREQLLPSLLRWQWRRSVVLGVRLNEGKVSAVMEDGALGPSASQRGFVLVVLDAGRRAGVVLERGATGKQMLAGLLYGELLREKLQAWTRRGGKRRWEDEDEEGEEKREEEEKGESELQRREGGELEEMLESCDAEGEVYFSFFWSELKDAGWKRKDLRLDAEQWRYEWSTE